MRGSGSVADCKSAERGSIPRRTSRPRRTVASPLRPHRRHGSSILPEVIVPVIQWLGARSFKAGRLGSIPTRDASARSGAEPRLPWEQKIASSILAAQTNDGGCIEPTGTRYHARRGSFRGLERGGRCNFGV